MSTQDDVRRLALELPGAEESTDGFGFSVMNGSKLRAFAWAWRDRALVREFEEQRELCAAEGQLRPSVDACRVEQVSACAAPTASPKAGPSRRRRH